MHWSKESVMLLQWLNHLNVKLEIMEKISPNRVSFTVSQHGTDTDEKNRNTIPEHVTAFHGTALENIHSILNNGLQTMTVHRNGEAFGKGIYLSTQLEVARTFSTQNRQRGFSWKHSELDMTAFGFTSREKLANYDIDCYCVFECLVDIGDTSLVHQQSSYLIVKDPLKIKVSKLHLYFGRSKKRSHAHFLLLFSWPTLILASVGVLGAYIFHFWIRNIRS
mmetsp:Transcript_6968/g.9106  ORF Transcript_6968/g.9106 Transcript_6968/m.9106 type:complete len:221 (+) Transcript_6968:229-891(+)